MAKRMGERRAEVGVTVQEGIDAYSELGRVPLRDETDFRAWSVLLADALGEQADGELGMDAVLKAEEVVCRRTRQVAFEHERRGRSSQANGNISEDAFRSDLKRHFARGIEGFPLLP